MKLLPQTFTNSCSCCCFLQAGDMYSRRPHHCPHPGLPCNAGRLDQAGLQERGRGCWAHGSGAGVCRQRLQGPGECLQDMVPVHAATQPLLSRLHRPGQGQLSAALAAQGLIQSNTIWTACFLQPANFVANNSGAHSRLGCHIQQQHTTYLQSLQHTMPTRK